jgi:predicted lipoprotein with Yx(FWY)xxD motif
MMKPSLLAAALALVASGALAETVIGTAQVGGAAIYVDGNGMSLYTFDNDAPGVSNCYDACATNWPPLMAGAYAQAQGDFGIIDRKDGGKQWTYKGMPLYTWINDKAPGDVTGDGVKGVWHLAHP